MRSPSVAKRSGKCICEFSSHTYLVKFKEPKLGSGGGGGGGFAVETFAFGCRLRDLARQGHLIFGSFAVKVFAVKPVELSGSVNGEFLHDFIVQF